MTKTLMIAALLLTSAAATPARAAEASGLSLGLRGAYGLPLGDAAGGTSLDDLTTGAAPVQCEVGWRFDEHWLAGAYFAAGPAFAADGGKDALRARGATDVGGHSEMRLGLQGIYTFSAMKRVSPWLGLALGYEWTRYAGGKLGGDEIAIGVRGWEATLQAGAAYAVTSRFSVGPFAALNVGQYRSSTEWVEDEDETSTRISDKGVHEWLQVGVRGSFDL